MSSEERRSGVRRPCAWRVCVYREDGRIDLLRANNCSLQGVQVCSDDRLPEDQVLRVAVRLYSQSRGQGIEVHARVRVAYNIFDGSQACFRTGLTFIEFEDDGRTAYEEAFHRAGSTIAEVSDRRVDARYRSRQAVRIEVGSDQWFDALTEDISYHGMHLKMEYRLIQGQPARLHLKLVHPLTGAVDPVIMRASVAWVFFASGGGFDTGMRIDGFEEGDGSAWRDHIHHRFEVTDKRVRNTG